MDLGHVESGTPEPGPPVSHGERLVVPERVIIAPTAGRFEPVPDGAADGVGISEEQIIGYVEGHGQSVPVTSPFRGLLMGLLAHSGERVREGQPVAWMRLA